MTTEIKTDFLTYPQICKKASAAIKKYVASSENKYLQYYFIKGNFHINNASDFATAKDICEKATGLKFIHFTNSIAKLNTTFYGKILQTNYSR